MSHENAQELTGPEKSEAIRHDAFAFIGLTLIAFSIAVFYVATEGVTANSVIYVSGAISSIVIALLAMRFAPGLPTVPDQTSRNSGGLVDFILKRGILFVLVQAPILAFLPDFSLGGPATRWLSLWY